MRTIASIGLIFAVGAGLVVAPAVSGETSAGRDQQLVVLPTSSSTRAGLQLSSLGIAELRTDGGAVVATLHVRAVIANTTRDRPWVLDASKARIAAIPGPPVAPAFVNSDVTTLPIAILEPGERRTIDLYFPLSAELATLGGPTSFALVWPINTPARVVQSAWFERDGAIALSASDVSRAAGWGHHWWFDPTYPWSTYFHRPGTATPRPPAYVIVTKAPRWDALPAVASDEERPRNTECQDW
jgi:hypothetical protein